MNFYDLIVFYTLAAQREFDYVMETQDPNNLELSDFAHKRFCDGVVNTIAMALVRSRFESSDRIIKFTAGLRLYERWQMDRDSNWGDLN